MPGSCAAPSRWSEPLPTWFALLVIWGLGALAWWPALDGPWLYDDGQLQGPIATMHAQGLSALAGNGWREQLIMAGNVPGRPLAMASFALNALAGTDPFGFKAVNLALHLATGTLVFLLIRVLAGAAAGERRSDAFALVVALVWVLHPLQVSTVAYVVQRMTILSALFSVAALGLYARVRVREVAGGPPARLLELVWPLLVLPPLAFLCKENGALLPLLLLTMELVLFRLAGTTRTKHHLTAYFGLAGIALVVLAAALLPPDRLLAAYAGRDFTLGERLLTQPRMLTLYVGQILLPRPDWMGFYYDGVELSRGLLRPPTTLAAIAFLLGLFGLGLALVRRRPLAAFGILFFFAGHLMESSVLPLLMAFEHRNYLPSLGLILAAADLLAGARGDLARWRPLITAVVLAAVFALTGLRSLAWGSSEGIWRSALNARLPSRGARADYAQWLTEQGRLAEARRLLTDAYGLGPRLHEGYLDCLETRRLEPARIRDAMAQSDVFPDSYEASAVMVIGKLAVDGTCAIPRTEFLRLLGQVAADQRFSGDRRAAFLQYQAHLYQGAGEAAQALAALESGFALAPANPVPLLTAAQWCLDADDPTAARAYYARARAVKLAPSSNLDALFAEVAGRLQAVPRRPAD